MSGTPCRSRGLGPAPAVGMQAGVHHQPSRPHEAERQRAERTLGIAVEPPLFRQLLGIEPPALAEGSEGWNRRRPGRSESIFVRENWRWWPGTPSWKADPSRSQPVTVGISVLNQNVPGRLPSSEGGL